MSENNTMKPLSDALDKYIKEPDMDNYFDIRRELKKCRDDLPGGLGKMFMPKEERNNLLEIEETPEETRNTLKLVFNGFKNAFEKADKKDIKYLAEKFNKAAEASKKLSLTNNLKFNNLLKFLNQYIAKPNLKNFTKIQEEMAKNKNYLPNDIKQYFPTAQEKKGLLAVDQDINKTRNKLKVVFSAWSNSFKETEPIIFKQCEKAAEASTKFTVDKK